MVKGIIIITILLLFSSSAGFAQKQWTLNECIEYALKNNLDIESYALTNETNRERLEQSKKNRLPYIDAGSRYSINYGKSVDPNTNAVTINNFASNSYSVQGGISLFEGFIRNNHIAWSRFTYLAGLEQQRTLETDIAFEVMNAFHNSLYFKGLLKIVNEQKELSELNLEKVKKEVEVGIGAKTEVLEIEARLAEEELQAIRTRNYLRASLLELKKAMNFPVSEELHLLETNDIDTIESAIFENADSVYSLALEHLPAVKAKHQQLKAVEKSLAVAKGSLYPSLSLYGGYYTGFYETNTDNLGNIISFKNQFKNNASQSVGISLSIPVFNRWKNRSEIKINKLELEKERVNLDNYKNQLYYEIESYCQELSAMSAEYIQAKKQTESNRLAFEVAEKKKEQGLFNIIDLYTSKNLLSNAQSELLRTKLQFLLKRKTIDFYLGKPVFDIEN
jgi:outer membrane protein